MSANFDADLAARFAIELAKSEALRMAVQTVGRERARMIWSLGWITGKEAGLTHAQEIMTGGKS